MTPISYTCVFCLKALFPTKKPPLTSFFCQDCNCESLFHRSNILISQSLYTRVSNILYKITKIQGKIYLFNVINSSKSNPPIFTFPDDLIITPQIAPEIISSLLPFL